jgi:hypothetical protein
MVKINWKKKKKKVNVFLFLKIRVPIIFPMCSHMVSMMFPNGVPNGPSLSFIPYCFPKVLPFSQLDKGLQYSSILLEEVDVVLLP